MAWEWTHQDRPTWDDDKRRVVGGAPQGALDVHAEPGAHLPGDWWEATDEQGQVVGFGWLDSTWGGDAEIALAVASESQGSGVGSFVLGRLEDEAAARGMNYVYNTVQPTHPDRDAVHDWLAGRGYRGSDSDKALRKRVERSRPASTSPPQPSAQAAPAGSPRPPGGEESGGYVDVDEHRY